jgi:hypothetical protein
LNIVVAADDPLFSMPLGENREGWTVWMTRERVWERYRTLGQVAVLEGAELEVSFFSYVFVFLSSLSFPPTTACMFCVLGSGFWSGRGFY